MKGLILFISLVLFAAMAIGKSGILVTVPYTDKKGNVPVEKTRLEWHPEKLGFLDIRKRFKKSDSSDRKPSTPARKSSRKTEPPTHRILLQGKTAVLEGRILEQNEKGILFSLEEGDVFFNHEEIDSLEEIQ